jgi:hypothetical protein
MLKNTFGVAVLITGLLFIAGSCKDHDDPQPSSPESIVFSDKIGTDSLKVTVPSQRCVGAVGAQCEWVKGSKGKISVGGILHDNCCIFNYPNGSWCHNGGKDQKVCDREWWKAVANSINKREWEASFSGQPDNTMKVGARGSDIPATSETVATSKLEAPDRTTLDKTDVAFCRAKSFQEDRSTLAKQNYGTCGKRASLIFIYNGSQKNCGNVSIGAFAKLEVKWVNPKDSGGKVVFPADYEQKISKGSYGAINSWIGHRYNKCSTPTYGNGDNTKAYLHDGQGKLIAESNLISCMPIGSSTLVFVSPCWGEVMP